VETLLFKGVKSWAATTFACAAIIHPLKGISMRQRRRMEGGSVREEQAETYPQKARRRRAEARAEMRWHRGQMEKGRSEASFPSSV